MARPNVIYNCQALFVGPAPESGYNYFDYNGGTATNDHSNLVQKINRLNPIDRVQSVTYQINIPHENVLQINQRGIVDQPIINHPTVDLSFNYFLCGTKNEARLGFNVNYPLYHFPFDGVSYYADNNTVPLLTGFFQENKSFVQNKSWEKFEVPVYRDCKNIYVAVNQDGNDINKFYQKEDFLSPDIYQSIDPSATGYHVISFGNCYLNSYSVNGAVGQIPAASASYTAYNVNFDMSGSGFQAPGIETKSGTISPEKDVVIPRVLPDEGYPALEPGDITVTTDSFSGLGVDFDKLHLQSYGISINLPREPLNNLGYKFPVDTKVNSPVFASLTIDGIVESGNSGSLVDLISINSGYDFTIKVDPQGCVKSTAAPINAGTIPINTEVESLRYTFLGAKLESFNYETSIGDNKTFNASFTVEVNPDDQTKGLFISGVLGMEKVEDFILLEGTPDGGSDQDGYYLQQETDDLLVTNLIPPY
tara:strand:- start:155 stop:1588 length:1434 start_codon:yes stop_codon:yes gene_type:complete